MCVCVGEVLTRASVKTAHEVNGILKCVCVCFSLCVSAFDVSNWVSCFAICGRYISLLMSNHWCRCVCVCVCVSECRCVCVCVCDCRCVFV